MGRREKNFNDSLLPLTTMLATFGHAVFQYPSGRPRVSLSVGYAIIATTIYWYLFILKLDHSMGTAQFGTEDTVIYNIVYVNFFIAVLTQFFHWYYYKKFQDIVKRMIEVDQSLCTLGAIFDYAGATKCAMIFIIYWLAMVVFENCIDALWFYEKVPGSEIVIVVCTIHYPIHINAMVSLYYSRMISQIGERFCKANKLIEDVFGVNRARSTNVKRPPSLSIRSKVSGDVSSQVVSNARKIGDEPAGLLQIVRHVHLEMTLLAGDFQRIYSIVISLEMAAYFVMFTGLLYVLYFMIVVVTPATRLLRIIVVVTAIFTYIPIFVLINHACETTIAEAERTGVVIHRIENDHQDSNLNDEIKQFHLQLMTNRLTFSPLGFFPLGYGFLRGFLGTVVTYLVILIQMGSDPQLNSP